MMRQRGPRKACFVGRRNNPVIMSFSALVPETNKEGSCDAMATTGFWLIKGSLRDVINYADNPDKTTNSKYLDDDLGKD